MPPRKPRHKRLQNNHDPREALPGMTRNSPQTPDPAPANIFALRDQYIEARFTKLNPMAQSAPGRLATGKARC